MSDKGYNFLIVSSIADFQKFLNFWRVRGRNFANFVLCHTVYTYIQHRRTKVQIHCMAFFSSNYTNMDSIPSPINQFSLFIIISNIF